MNHILAFFLLNADSAPGEETNADPDPQFLILLEFCTVCLQSASTEEDTGDERISVVFAALDLAVVVSPKWMSTALSTQSVNQRNINALNR